MLRKALGATLVAASLATSMVPAAGAAGLIVRVGPPAPRVEVVPAPRHGYVWAPGYWDWRGHRHVWVAGTWVRERPGYRYVGTHWVERNGGWVIERGHYAHGDHDHDGVPNRYDHAPDNPYRR